MKEQGVIDIYKFPRPSDDDKMIITFDLYNLPSTVDLAWCKCKVEHFKLLFRTLISRQ